MFLCVSDMNVMTFILILVQIKMAKLGANRIKKGQVFWIWSQIEPNWQPYTKNKYLLIRSLVKTNFYFRELHVLHFHFLFFFSTHKILFQFVAYYSGSQTFPRTPSTIFAEFCPSRGPQTHPPTKKAYNNKSNIICAYSTLVYLID